MKKTTKQNPPLKQHEFKSGQHVLFEHEGRTHKGIVEVEGRAIFICQEVWNGDYPKNLHGMPYGYLLNYRTGDGFLSDCHDELKNIRLDHSKSPKPATAYRPEEPDTVIRRRRGHEFTKTTINGNTLEEYNTAIQEKVRQRDELNAELADCRWAFKAHKRLDGNGLLD